MVCDSAQRFKVHEIIYRECCGQQLIEDLKALRCLSGQFVGLRQPSFRMRLGGLTLEPLAILLRCTRSGQRRALRSPPGRVDLLGVLPRRCLRSLIGQLRLMLQLRKESTTTCHFSPQVDEHRQHTVDAGLNRLFRDAASDNGGRCGALLRPPQ